MSPEFSFQLQQVLDYRRQLEEKAQLALAEAKRALKAQKALLDDLKRKYRENEEELQGRKELSSGEVWLHKEYKERLLQEIAAAKNKLHQLSERTELCRLELVERAKDKKLLEKLKDTKALEFARQEQAKEQKAFDETATLRHQDRDPQDS